MGAFENRERVITESPERARERLDRLASGFFEARVVITALELDLFTALGDEELAARALAARAGVDPEALERLCNALVALRLLRKRKKGSRGRRGRPAAGQGSPEGASVAEARGLFRNTPAARRWLCADSPDDMGDLIRHRAGLWERWSGLTEVVRRGRVPPRRPSKGDEQRETRRFMRGMANLGLRSARETVAALRPELRGAKRLIDLGGGPGVYGCEFARRHTALRVTVFDRPGPLGHARATIRQAGLGARVRVRAGDLTDDRSYGRGYDVAFFSNVIHCLKRPEAQRAIARAVRCLRAGGALVIKDFTLERDGTAPRFAALFSINMLVCDAGDCYSLAELAAWMSAAGAPLARTARVANNSLLVVGRRA